MQEWNRDSRSPVIAPIVSVILAAAIILLSLATSGALVLNISFIHASFPKLINTDLPDIIIFLCMGVALLLYNLQSRLYIAVRVISLLVALAGSVGILLYIFGTSIISPLVAMNFFFAGTALFFKRNEEKFFIYLRDVINFFGFWLSFAALLGYIFSVPEFYSWGTAAPISLISALLFLLLFSGIYLSSPHTTIVQLMIDPSTIGIMMRFLMPTVIVVPLLTGIIVYSLVFSGRIDYSFGFALYTFLNILVLNVLLFSAAVAISRATSEKDDLSGQLLRKSKELMASNKKLEEELEKHKITSEKLAENVRELESFSYSISHDLRSPLRSISGFSRILEEEYAHALDDEGKRLLQVIINSSKRMNTLIDDLLAFSRLSKQQKRPSHLHMTEMVQKIMEEIKLRKEYEHIQVEINDLPTGFGDQSMIRQVLYNLMDNAFKYTHKNQDAKIVIKGWVEGDENVYAIQDNGAGFDMAYYNKLFGVFQRLHRQEDFEGTGIGLALVHHIIQRHNGRIWAEGKIDEGATFYFTLPVKG